jgi:hypothetical protein
MSSSDRVYSLSLDSSFESVSMLSRGKNSKVGGGHVSDQVLGVNNPDGTKIALA